MVPLRLLINISRQHLLLPFYHIVSDTPPPHIKHLYSVKTIREFRKDLDFLLKYYKPVDAQMLYNITLKGEKRDKKVFHLTFDDGLQEMYHIVAPILYKKGIPATFFINSEFVGNQNLFYRYQASLILENRLLTNQLADEFRKTILSISYHDKDLLNQWLDQEAVRLFLEEQQPYMTKDQILNLSNRGFTIGAHSVDHPVYYQEPVEQQLRQTKESLDFIRQLVPQKLRLFAFPFTDYGVSKEFFDLISPHVDLTFGTAGLKKDEVTFNLQRIAAEKRKTNVALERIVRMEYLEYILKVCLGKEGVYRS